MMQLRNLLRCSFVCALFAGCASDNGQGAPMQVDQMMTWIERVHIDAERSRESVADSFERLNLLAAGRFDKDPAAVVYARFVQSIDVAEQEAARFRESVGPMLSAAKPVFERWREDVQKITSERMRQRSELRFQVAKERYDAIEKVAIPAQDQLDKFVASLRDHALFLGNDLNAGALDEIQQEVRVVAKTALELDEKLESTMAAARAYVEQSSLPAASPGR
ncbi:MAG: DUF2959 family protein [Planctomycetota bacterium]